MIKNIMIFNFLLLTSCTAYRMPGKGVSEMSGDTLCYRYAYAKSDKALAEEVAARNLDCRAVLEQQQGEDSSF